MAKVSKIIGVDPGTNILGYAVIEIIDKKPRVQDIGVLNLTGFKDHQTKLKEIFLQLQEIIETYLPQHMAVEAPFFGKNVQSMLKLGRAQGVSMAAAMTMGLEIIEYSPKKIKQSITGNGNASKEQVAAMLKNMLKFKVKEHYLDATDALAAAICHHHQISSGGVSIPKTNSWKKFLKENPGRIKS
ncbi:MAG: crossover junction endodeoxyribonuclease RuvC [Saprospiraceae bacterium]|nr:crossover junction endodeoxyribonuclease RuvC [Bacteroidia bacterium]NNE13617.1 crossover junction endodeoxyribonuclease RuvC [Saprospiraceae bacterium]NNL91436.1 crossover junction endodeoxyribonuclease RuvC [Saprospiraceae bacterium]